MKLFVTIYNDHSLLGHFLRHYRAIGVDQFFIAIPSRFSKDVERIAEGYPVTLFRDLDVVDSLLAGTAAVGEMRRLHQQPDEWVVIADLDEFVECPSLPPVAAAADAAGCTVVRGIMHDRFSVDGLPKEITPDSDLPALFPVKSRFIRNVMKACDHKGLLVKGHLKGPPLAAHHRFDGERVFRDELEISHYKWNASAIDRLRESYRIVRAAGQAWAIEYQRTLEHYDAHGRFAWETFGGQLSHEFRREPPAAHCADCGAAMSEAERDYSLSTFGKKLCRTDQNRYRTR